MSSHPAAWRLAAGVLTLTRTACVAGRGQQKRPTARCEQKTPTAVQSPGVEADRPGAAQGGGVDVSVIDTDIDDHQNEPTNESPKMAPINLRCQWTFTNFTSNPVEPTFIEFDDLNWSDTYRTCSICVRIDVKFPVNSSDDRLHFILMDRTGAKIEAIVAGNDLVHIFDLTLHMGRKYIIHGVTIRPNFEEVEHRFINHTYECSFSARTFVESVSLEFPRYPKHLMSIHEVMRCPNKTFVDIVGIVVQYDDHQLIGRHPSAELYREVTFMDIWSKLIVVGISGGNLIQNSYRWSTTEGNKSIVLATMLRKNRKYGNLETSSYTTLAFNPDHPSARALDGCSTRDLPLNATPSSPPDGSAPPRPSPDSSLPSTPPPSCNDKLIGAKFFYKGYEAGPGHPINETLESKSPLDTEGYDTHTTSTAAGSPVDGAGFYNYAHGRAVGMAPTMRIAAYKICWKSGCYDSDILATFDEIPGGVMAHRHGSPPPSLRPPSCSGELPLSPTPILSHIT
ncbi:hypothetical protein ZWY2020_038837 [Hordeum vulgare]|nr:hypothetical protein ZWY2020_038837 [Hordeum vulgare]